MSPRKTTIAILAALSVSLALADDFKTNNGKEYKNATISRVEPDGIVVKFRGGIVKIPFTDLSEELRRKYNYNREAARTYAADILQQSERATQQFQEPNNKGNTQEESSMSRGGVELKYNTPEELTAAAHKGGSRKDVFT